MKKLFKFVLSCCCLVAVGGCAYICLYEIYNSYFSDEPKNIVTYHKATSSTADVSEIVNKIETGDDFDNSLFSTGNTLGYTDIQDACIIDSDTLTDLYLYSEKYVVLVTSSNYDNMNGTIISIDDDYIYIATDYSESKGASSFTVTFADGTECSGRKYRHDSVRDILLIYISKNQITEETLSVLKDVSSDEPSDTLTAGTSVIAIGAKYNNTLNVSAGNLKSELKTVSFGNADVNYYEAAFSDLCNLSGSVVIDVNGNVIGIYTGEGIIIPLEDIYALMK
ncbi:MAG: trypsin-like peptidase domain-containing protein [Lachnospiraceae bacterium]